MPQALADALATVRPRSLAISCSPVEDVAAEDDMFEQPALRHTAPRLAPEQTMEQLLAAVLPAPSDATARCGGRATAPDEISWEAYEYEAGPHDPASVDERMLGLPALKAAIGGGALLRVGLRFPHRRELMPTLAQLGIVNDGGDDEPAEAPAAGGGGGRGRGRGGRRGRGARAAPGAQPPPAAKLTAEQTKAIQADADALRSALRSGPAAAAGAYGAAADDTEHGLTVILGASENVGFFANHRAEAAARGGGPALGQGAPPMSEGELAAVVRLFDRTCSAFVEEVCRRGRRRGGGGGEGSEAAGAAAALPHHHPQRLCGLEIIGWATHRRKVIQSRSHMPLTVAACEKHDIKFLVHD